MNKMDTPIFTTDNNNNPKNATMKYETCICNLQETQTKRDLKWMCKVWNGKKTNGGERGREPPLWDGGEREMSQNRGVGER